MGGIGTKPRGEPRGEGLARASWPGRGACWQVPYLAQSKGTMCNVDPNAKNPREIPDDQHVTCAARKIDAEKAD